MNQTIYGKFEEYLINRISSGQHLTEDSVRYSFFAALINQKFCKQADVILEIPHPKITNAEIDSLIKLPKLNIFLEFKYHRKTRSNSPKPDKAGSLFKDFNRLSLLEQDGLKYVIYFTDYEMAAYFKKHQSQYGEFWLYKEKESFEFNDQYLLNTNKTFRKACGESKNCRVETIYTSKFKTAHEIRIFQIHSGNRS